MSCKHNCGCEDQPTMGEIVETCKAAIDQIRAGSIDPHDQNAAILELDERLRRVEAMLANWHTCAPGDPWYGLTPAEIEATIKCEPGHPDYGAKTATVEESRPREPIMCQRCGGAKKTFKAYSLDEMPMPCSCR